MAGRVPSAVVFGHRRSDVKLVKKSLRQFFKGNSRIIPIYQFVKDDSVTCWSSGFVWTLRARRRLPRDHCDCRFRDCRSMMTHAGLPVSRVNPGSIGRSSAERFFPKDRSGIFLRIFHERPGYSRHLDDSEERTNKFASSSDQDHRLTGNNQLTFSSPDQARAKRRRSETERHGESGRTEKTGGAHARIMGGDG